MITKQITTETGTIDVTVTVDEIKSALESNEGLQKELRQTGWADRIIQQAVETNSKKHEEKFTGWMNPEDHKRAIDEAVAAKNTELRDLKINHAIDLNFNGVKHSELLRGALDMSKITVGEDGKVQGIETEIERLKGTYADLFTTETKTFQSPPHPGGNKVDKPLTYDEFKNMSKEQRAKLPMDTLKKMLSE